MIQYHCSSNMQTLVSQLYLYLSPLGGWEWGVCVSPCVRDFLCPPTPPPCRLMVVCRFSQRFLSGYINVSVRLIVISYKHTSVGVCLSLSLMRTLSFVYPGGGCAATYIGVAFLVRHSLYRRQSQHILLFFSSNN